MFRDRTTGKIVLGQKPNLLIVLFMAAFVIRAGLGVLDASSQLQRIAGFVALGFLGAWAIDELVRGVNPFRRFLGAGVLIFVGLSLWKLL